MSPAEEEGIPTAGGRAPSAPGLHVTRRQLLAAAMGAAGAAALSRVVFAQEPPPLIDTTKFPGSEPLEVGERTPFEMATRFRRGHAWFAPLDRFLGSITPSALHFVVARMDAWVPDVDPRTYRLLIHGMVEKPRLFSLQDLKRFPSVSRTHFLECAGNSANAWFPPVAGDTVQNVHGLVSNSEWTGVPLEVLLTEVGAAKDATWLLTESQDSAVYARSLPAGKAWSDALVAYGQNGEALRPEQGYPVRLFVPGWEGAASVKWLRRIELTNRPTMTKDETSQYTDAMPDGTAIQFTYTMGVKSLITWPSAGYRLPATGFWEITGMAWSGAGRIAAVEVSTDGGMTWALARLQEPVLPLAVTRFTFPWVWPGKESLVMSRATDDQGHVQPPINALVKERGLNSLYHNNAIQVWKVGADGGVTATHAPFALEGAP